MSVIVATKDDGTTKQKGDILEELASKLLKQRGFEVEREVAHTGSEIDLECVNKVNRSQKIYVECKAYSNNKTIESEELDKLAGKQQRLHYTEAWIITTTEFSKGSKGQISEYESSGQPYPFSFYSPKKLTDALIDSGNLISDESAREKVIEIGVDPHSIKEHHLLITADGYFWLFEHAASMKVTGYIVVSSDKHAVLTDRDDLIDLGELKTYLPSSNYLEVFRYLPSSEGSIFARKRHLNFRVEYEKYLNDLVIKVSHPKVTEVSLEDIFIFPDVIDIDDKDESVIDSAKILAFDEPNSIFLYGEDVSGKTSIAKIVQIKQNAKGMIPVFIDAAQIKASSMKRFEKLIVKNLLAQYVLPDSRESVYEALEKFRADFFIIIDNYEEIGIPRIKDRVEFIHQLHESYDRLLILGNKEIELEAKTRLETQLVLKKFHTYRIRQLGHLKRDQIIQKWLSLGSDDSDYREIIDNATQIAQRINTAIGAKFIPTYPFYILTILHLIEAGTKNQTASSSYAELYSYFISSALYGSGVKPDDVDFYITYLSHLAYYMFEKGSSSISSDDIQLYFSEYLIQMGLKFDFEHIHKVLVSAKLLRSYDSEYSFALDYCRYYFIAKYLSDNIDDEDVESLISRIINNMHKNDSANIVIFLIHHSRSKKVITTILEKARSIFQEFEPQRLEADDIKGINNLITEEIKYSLKEDSSKLVREKELKNKDRYENSNSDPEEDVDANELFSKINLALKTIDVLGQINNNHYGFLKADLKEKILRETYDLGLRSLKAFLDSFQEYSEALRNYLLENIDKNKDTDKEVDRLIYSFVQILTLVFIKRISDSNSSRNMFTSIEKVEHDNPKVANKLILAASKLNFPGELVKEKANIVELNNSLRQNRLPHDVLMMIVIGHIYRYDISRNDFQSICSLLGISYEEASRKRRKIQSR